MVLPAGVGGKASAGLASSKRTRVHCPGSCGAGVGVLSFEQTPTKWNVCTEPFLTVTLKRPAPAPRWLSAVVTIPATPVIRAPAEEQSAVGPFFDSSSPVCGSLGVVALGPPLSGRPMPPSHLDVTMRLPAGAGAQAGAAPKHAKGEE